METSKKRAREAEVFEEIMIEVHKQWLNEFDVEAARNRRAPRRYRDDEPRARHGFFRRRRSNAAAPAAPCLCEA
jgi:hypothetical protein